MTFAFSVNPSVLLMAAAAIVVVWVVKKLFED